MPRWLTLLTAALLAGCALPEGDEARPSTAEDGPIRLALAVNPELIEPGVVARVVFEATNQGESAVWHEEKRCAFATLVLEEDRTTVPTGRERPPCEDRQLLEPLRPGRSVGGAFEWNGTYLLDGEYVEAPPGTYLMVVSFQWRPQQDAAPIETTAHATVGVVADPDAEPSEP